MNIPEFFFEKFEAVMTSTWDHFTTQISNFLNCVSFYGLVKSEPLNSQNIASKKGNYLDFPHSLPQ